MKFILALLFSIQVHAQIQETPDLKSCLNSAAHATAALSPHDVIYVFDIDNTVLSLNQNFGSVQWFRWQQKLIQDNIEKDRVATTIDELLTKQGLIYHLSKTHTPETTTAATVLNLQRIGHPVLYHTSRSTDTRDITERDLKSNGLLPLQNTVGPIDGYAGTFMFLNGPANQRAVSYQNGIYMSVGQDKGIWLKFLFEKTSKELKHLVFVDDELKNLQNVERAFNGVTPTTLCRYSAVDNTVNDFNQSDKAKEIELWQKLSAVTAIFL